MSNLQTLGLRSAAALFVLALAACQQQPAASEESAVTAPSAPVLTSMPISINATMVSTVSASADFLFAIGNGDLPRNEHDWNKVRYHAYEMMLAGQVMKIPGTGEGDKAWTESPEWQTRSQDLTDIGAQALALAESRSTDEKAWQEIGARLIDNCEGCHQKFKPEIPSQGIFHEGGKAASEGKSIFD